MMAKAVVYALLASAIILLITFSPIRNHGRCHHTRLGFSRRVGYKFPIPIFDPLVLKLQRIEEQNGLNNETNPTNLDDGDKQYLTDDGKLNFHLRLLVLFPLLDKNPKDGVVSLEELAAWNSAQVMERSIQRTNREMKIRDENGDGGISFGEYLPQFSDEDIARNQMEHGEAGWWMVQFRNADVDGNGLLNLEEFNNILHPEDSNKKEIKKWNLKDNIKRMDDDGDGKIKFSEFSKHAYEIYKNYAEFEPFPISTAHDMFSALDLNHDRLLDLEEMVAMSGYLKPGELSYAKYYSNYLIREADDDGDGKLTIDEMLNHEHTFYATVHGGREDDFHDEL